MDYIKSFLRYRFLLSELVKKGIRLKYRRSYLGIVWSLIEPLLTTIVLVIVFGTLFQRDVLPTYPLYIVIGRLTYGFFSTATKAASKSVRANASMIKKVYVPKYLYPISTVLYNFVIFLISLIVLVGVDIYCKVIPTWYILQFIPALILLLLLTFGVGMLLSTLNVFFRDIEYLWNVVCMLIMYMSAIFYYPQKLEASGFAWVLKYNPLYQIISISRDAVLGAPMDMWGFFYTLGFSLVTLLLGIIFFKKNQDEFILHL